jgi:hypothetical protein
MTLQRAATEPVAAFIPHVAEAAALDDRSWFADHPERRFRARSGDGGIWLTRQRQQGNDPNVYLRTFAPAAIAPGPAAEGEVAVLWCQAAYPGWPPEQVHKAVRKALCKLKRP